MRPSLREKPPHDLAIERGVHVRSVPRGAGGDPRFASPSEGTNPSVTASILTDDRDRLRLPGVLFGVGFGGFVDGVVLHQILQWHHLLTSTGDHPATTVAGLETNTLADGMFHLAALIVLLVAVSMLWRRIRDGARATWRSIVGTGLAGWGAFNLAEGLVAHHLLGIHHVREGPDALGYDLGFLAVSIVLVTVGLAIARNDLATSAAGTLSPGAAGRRSRAA